MKKLSKLTLQLLSLLVAGVVLGGCSSNSDSSNNEKSASSSSSQSSKTVKDENKTYKVGDTVKVGDVTYTLTNVEKTDERNEFENETANVIKVTYHVKNDSSTDITLGTDLSVYGPNNQKLNSYALPNATVLDSIAPGKEADVTEAFASDALGEFELQFKPLISIKKPAIFETTIQ